MEERNILKRIILCTPQTKFWQMSRVWRWLSSGMQHQLEWQRFINDVDVYDFNSHDKYFEDMSNYVKLHFSQGFKIQSRKYTIYIWALGVPPSHWNYFSYLRAIWRRLTLLCSIRLKPYLWICLFHKVQCCVVFLYRGQSWWRTPRNLTNCINNCKGRGIRLRYHGDNASSPQRLAAGLHSHWTMERQSSDMPT